MAEQLAQKPDEFVFAGKIKSVTRLPNRATSQGNVLAERIEFDVIGLMKGTLPARVELVNVNDGICWENSPTPPTDKLTFVMAKRREGTGELESTKFAIGEEALSLLIAFTNAGMRAKPPKP
ncbi:MAG: hypothetical protein Q8R82_15335 [Hyphomonadaceae bacterium]|nr:hypothetical protein [Hyphomonadaceae bacterium]